jgi:hypothetical protein
MHMGLVKIDIIDNDSLLKACDILHDGYCDLSNVLYDEKNGCWKAIFEREFLEEPTGIRNGGQSPISCIVIIFVIERVYAANSKNHH